jgi:hypothetical protein
VDDCPTGSTLVASTEEPQTIALDSTNAYWTSDHVGDGGTTLSTGTVQYIARSASSGVPNNLATGLSAPFIVNAGDGYVAYSVLGAGGKTGTTGTVGLYNVSLGGTPTTPGTSLQAPAGVAIDSTNAYWISSTGGAGVVVQSASLAGGSETTLGTVSGSYLAGGLTVASGNLYFAAYLTPAGSGGGIYMVSTTGGTPTPVQVFSTGQPYGVVSDSSNVYWTDPVQGGVYDVPLGGGTITTLTTGVGTSYFLAVDSKNVYTADSAVAGAIYSAPISGGGGATATKLIATTSPSGVAADNNDNFVYFTTAGAICSIAK